MGKKGGYPQGLGSMNMNNLMKQAQRMQRQMQESQQQLEETDFTATAGGGVVEVTISGKREVKALTLKEEVVDPEDIEMLQDLIIAAVNEALKKIDDAQAASMPSLPSDLGSLGGLSF